MTEYLFSFLWTGAQLIFAYLFFGCFLEQRLRKEEALWFLLTAWLAAAVYTILATGSYGYLAFLLCAVLMLLYIFREASGKGLSLLTLMFLICTISDLLFRYISSSLFVISIGKLLPLGTVWLLRRHRKPPNTTQEDAGSMLLRQHMEMQQESMRTLEQNYRIQRQNTHEFEHHMQVLRDLLEQDATDVARDYLDKLKKNRSIHTMHVNSHHPVVDVILNQKYQTSRENEIQMQIRVNDLSAVKLPADSLAVVLTNLLDNAIEACRRIDGYREIFCSIVFDDSLYISIRNTSEPVQIADGRIPTSKQDSLSHGFGLISVRHTLDQLHAEYTFRYEGGWFHFAAEIQ